MSKATFDAHEDDEETPAHSRRAFLTRGAVGTAAAVAGGAALTALAATPAGAAVGDVVFQTPVRVFDSRTGNADGTAAAQGIFTRGDGPRTIGFGVSALIGGTNIIPSSADGAIINVTVTQTVANGALAITDAATGSTTVSSINWFASGNVLANGMLVPVSFISGGKFNNDLCGINIHVVGGVAGVAKTHCIIDCSGYVAGA